MSIHFADPLPQGYVDQDIQLSRKIHYIDVGDMPPALAKEKVEEIKGSLTRLSGNPALEKLHRDAPKLKYAVLSISDIAKSCHEANKGLCEAYGDFSQKSWEDAADWQRVSAVKGVIFNIENPTAPASSSHDSWLKEKADTGWKYGPVKDAENKEHPCFVPYDELPVDQKSKDHVFKAVVASLKHLLA